VTLAAIPSRYVAFQGITKVQGPELTRAGFFPETLWLDPEKARSVRTHPQQEAS